MGRQTTFGMSGSEWRHLAGHHLVEQWRDSWRKEMDKEAGANVGVSSVTSQITTAKTVVLQVYLKHLRTTFRHIEFMKMYHSKEHTWNFFKYRREQTALCEVVKRVKGNDGATKERSQIIVAFGNGKFGNSGRKGSRGAPVEKFKKRLRRHVILVTPDEYRTSRACSKCWIKDCWDGTKSDDDISRTLCVAHSLTNVDVGEEDEVSDNVEEPYEEDNTTTEAQKQWLVVRSELLTFWILTPSTENRDVDPMYIFKANRQKGAPIHAVRHCQKCSTTWNRDTNAARNIAFVFWYERKHGPGQRPLPLRRVRKVTSAPDMKSVKKTKKTKKSTSTAGVRT